MNFIYSIQFPRARPSKGWPSFISLDKEDFFFSFEWKKELMEGWKKLAKKFWKWIDIEFLIAVLLIKRPDTRE